MYCCTAFVPQGLVDDMDVYRRPAPGAPQSVVATGSVRVDDPSVLFAAM